MAQQLGQHAGPVIASTDYMKNYAEQIRPFVPKGRSYRVLGTDGFGPQRFPQQNCASISRDQPPLHQLAALQALADEGTVPLSKVAEAIKIRHRTDKINPLYAQPPGDREMARLKSEVPDIGDFAEVAVIELLVKPGDTVKAGAEPDHRWNRTKASDGNSLQRGRCGQEPSPSSWATRSAGLGGAGSGRRRRCACPEAPAVQTPTQRRTRKLLPDSGFDPAPPRSLNRSRCASRHRRLQDVAVIEVPVKPGDTVKLEQSLITVSRTRRRWRFRPRPPAW